MPRDGTQSLTLPSFALLPQSSTHVAPFNNTENPRALAFEAKRETAIQRQRGRQYRGSTRQLIHCAKEGGQGFVWRSSNLDGQRMQAYGYIIAVYMLVSALVQFWCMLSGFSVSTLNEGYRRFAQDSLEAIPVKSLRHEREDSSHCCCTVIV